MKIPNKSEQPNQTSEIRIKWSEIRIFACHSGSEFLKADNFAKGLLFYKKN